jgi:hypothetical protein
VSENAINMDDLKAFPTKRSACWIERQEHDQNLLDMHGDMDDEISVIPELIFLIDDCAPVKY